MEYGFQIVLGLIVLIGAIIAAYALIMRLRRSALEDTEEQSGGLAFSLDELGKLRDAGKLDEEEYQTLRAAAIAEAGFDPDAPGMAEARRQAEELRSKRSQGPQQSGETRTDAGEDGGAYPPHTDA